MPAENTRSTGADRRTTGDCHDAALLARAPEAQVSAAVDLLREHNIWRRGGDGPQTDPTALGIAIDVVVNALSEPVGVGCADELMLNIQRACKRGRNAADPSAENSSFIASFDHIEDLAQQARRVLALKTAAALQHQGDQPNG